MAGYLVLHVQREKMKRRECAEEFQWIEMGTPLLFTTAECIDIAFLGNTALALKFGELYILVRGDYNVW